VRTCQSLLLASMATAVAVCASSHWGVDRTACATEATVGAVLLSRSLPEVAAKVEAAGIERAQRSGDTGSF
jgi:hypothetical protein